MGLVLPPNEVFQQDRKSLHETQGGYAIQNWIKTVCPPSGGMFSYYEEHPFPMKGHPYPESIEANNIVKKLFVTGIVSIGSKDAILPLIGFIFTPYKAKIRWVEKILSNFCRTCDYVNRNHYLKRQFYNVFAKEIWDFTYHFLRNLGISDDIAYRTGRIIAHFIELDDAYRLRVQDIFNEMSKPSMLVYPRFEIGRLTKIYLSREKEGLSEKFTSISKIASYLFLVPRIKRAFTKAMEFTNVDNLRMDESDRYFSLVREGYNFLGRDDENRHQEFISIFNKHAIARFRNMVEKSVTDEEAKKKVTDQLASFGF